MLLYGKAFNFPGATAFSLLCYATAYYGVEEVKET
jgi:hypothetical protein